MRIGRSQLALLFGDILLLTALAIIGFINHSDINGFWESLTNGHFWALWVPIVIGWLIVSSLAGVLNLHNATKISQLWRVALVAVIVMPIAVWVRSLFLSNDSIATVFVSVLILLGLATMIIWRLIYVLTTAFIKSHTSKAT